jgi:hypothetical protein
MKNYLTEWKKYLLKEESVEQAKTALQSAEAKIKALQINLGLAEKEKTMAADALEAAKDAALKQASPQQPEKSTPSPTISSSPTTPASMEEELDGRPEGTMGKQPGDSPDKINIKIKSSDSLAVVGNEELTDEEAEEACGYHKALEEGGSECELELEYQEAEEQSQCGKCNKCMSESIISEAKYKGRTVPLGKPMRGDVKKFKVFVRDPKTGNVKKVNFGDKKMRIKKSNPKRRKSFRARHNCANPGPRTKARYWSCRKW